MSFLSFFSAAGTALLLLSLSSCCSSSIPEILEFNEWVALFRSGDKAYISQEEHAHRLVIFEKNVRSMKMHNAAQDKGTHSYRMGVNQVHKTIMFPCRLPNN